MKTNNHEIDLLGHEVMDPVSGLRGIAESRTVFMNNNVRYTVQPKSKNGVKIDQAFDIDEHQLKAVGVGVSKLKIACPVNLPVDLGDEVKDIASGFKGVATERHESLNGCVYFAVLSKMVNDKEGLLQSRFSYDRLVRVGKGVKDKILDAQEKAFSVPRMAIKKKPERQGPGASMTKSIRY